MDSHRSVPHYVNLSHARRNRGCSPGFSLLELLVALLILSVGVLGAASLQLNALKYSSSAGHITHAGFIAQNMIERMRANAGQLAGYAGHYQGDCQSSVPAPGILARDRADFAAAVACQLPEGQARIDISNDWVEVELSWSEQRINDTPAQVRLRALMGAEI
ncbi:MAG: type IV pilus modification protein PilV [Gammaproteobacteria bacterium HGW-Gammaproteobacteria-11]|nr:MAG: type IV pilus modification protein PilV [Gammaproteobacteria bacterium HGW-Gammaproteobacteria-11]